MTRETSALGLVAAGATAVAAVLLVARRRAGVRTDVLLDEQQHRLAAARARYFNEVGDSAGF